MMETGRGKRVGGDWLGERGFEKGKSLSIGRRPAGMEAKVWERTRGSGWGGRGVSAVVRIIILAGLVLSEIAASACWRWREAWSGLERLIYV